jgi:hypothetical protein
MRGVDGAFAESCAAPIKSVAAIKGHKVFAKSILKPNMFSSHCDHNAANTTALYKDCLSYTVD